MSIDIDKHFLDACEEIDRLRAENAKLREALEYGLNVMMPEIHAQRTLWPGEVDAFEDRARAALGAEPEKKEG